MGKTYRKYQLNARTEIVDDGENFLRRIRSKQVKSFNHKKEELKIVDGAYDNNFEDKYTGLYISGRRSHQLKKESSRIRRARINKEDYRMYKDVD